MLFINKPVLNFNDWRGCYGVCIDCAVDIIRVDRDSWLDDKCHRHKFMELE